ncbi:MAG: site-specific DNA-methyltransferase [Candidatus Saccharibacteria bacterium]|nr:site-specific DNA-methyltransferase [Candidatus Saccharibacteria bacterium]
MLFWKDCLDLLNQFPSNCIDLIFADPPYNLSNDGYSVSSGRRVSVNKGLWDKSKGLEADFKFHLKWIKACRKILKPNGSLWVSGTYHSIYQCGWILQKQNWHILNDICWYKPNASPNLACRMFTASHETLIWAKKDKSSKHYFDYQTMKMSDFKSDQLKTPNRQMRSVWSIPTPPISEKKYGKHPTQKPLALLERIILSSSRENDLILDPFCGSSTTGVMSLKHNRSFIGIDTEKE